MKFGKKYHTVGIVPNSNRKILRKSQNRKLNTRLLTYLTWLTVMKYLCHKWPRICSTCRKHFPILSSLTTYYRICNQINTTGTTSGAGTANPAGAPEFTTSFNGVRVTRALVLYVCFVDRCLSFCTLSFGHCVVCSSSIYGF